MSTDKIVKLMIRFLRNQRFSVGSSDNMLKNEEIIHKLESGNFKEFGILSHCPPDGFMAFGDEYDKGCCEGEPDIPNDHPEYKQCQTCWEKALGIIQ